MRTKKDQSGFERGTVKHNETQHQSSRDDHKALGTGSPQNREEEGGNPPVYSMHRRRRKTCVQ